MRVHSSCVTFDMKDTNARTFPTVPGSIGLPVKTCSRVHAYLTPTHAHTDVSRLAAAGMAVTASIFTLTALSVDRYVAIRAPLSVPRITTKRQAIRVIVIIWFLAAIFVLPMVLVRDVYTVDFEHFSVSMAFCIEQWPSYFNKEVYSLVMLVVNYVVPIATITTSYSLIGRTLCSEELHRKTSESSSTVMLGRKRVARMLIAVIVVFFVCWLPYNITSLSLDFEPRFRDTLVLPFTMMFAHAHSAINPLLYWILNKRFRHCMKKALRCQPAKKRSIESPSPQYV